MLDDEEATRLIGAAVVGPGGDELGRVETVLTHAADNRAAWAAVAIADRQALVPLDDARIDGDRLVVRYEREQIASAPDVGVDHLDAGSARLLYEHYGIDDSVLRDDSGFPTDQARRREHGLSTPDTGADTPGHP